MKTLPTLILFLAIGIIGTLFTLGAMGKIDMPGMKSDKGPQIPAGYVKVVVTSTRIPAYTAVAREHVVNPATMDFAFTYLSKEDASRALQPNQFLGRVLARDKGAGYVFTEGDFLPEGTRSGVSAGVPPGKRAIVIETAKITGGHSLQNGDHFDLVSSMPVEQSEISAFMGPVVTSLTQRQFMRLAADGMTTPLVLAKNATVVRASTARQEPYMRRTGLVGGTVDVRYKPVEEITIAVDPTEVVAVSQALIRQAPIIAVTRSGRPDNIETDIYVPTPRPTPTPIPVANSTVAEVQKAKAAEEKITVIDTVMGKRAEQVVFRETIKKN